MESMQAGRLSSSNLLKNALLLSANKNILPQWLEVLLLWIEEFPLLVNYLHTKKNTWRILPTKYFKAQQHSFSSLKQFFHL